MRLEKAAAVQILATFISLLPELWPGILLTLTGWDFIRFSLVA